jgi:phytol kinase
MDDLKNTFILASSFLLLFGVAELLYHKLKVKVELTRKLVHIVTGLLTLLFPVMLNNHWLVLLLCSSFALILVVSLRFNLLKSINAIDRESVGSIAYPVAVYGCYLAYDYTGQNYLYYYLPILTLAICDPIAALTGKRWPIGKYKVGKDSKTLMGSSMFFLSALILSWYFIRTFTGDDKISIIGSALAVSAVATMTEAISRRGLDNITIPGAVLVMLFMN